MNRDDLHAGKDVENRRPLAEPIPWPGSRGLFTVPDDVIAAVTS